MLTYFWKARPAVSDLPRWIHSDLMLVLSVGLYGLFPPLFFPASCQLLSSLSLEIRFRPCFDIVSGRFESSPERPSWWESSHCFQQSSSSMFPCTPLGACLKCATKDLSKRGTNRNQNLVRRQKNTGITGAHSPPKTNIALETLLEYDFSFCEGEGRWGSDPICWRPTGVTNSVHLGISLGCVWTGESVDLGIMDVAASRWREARKKRRVSIEIRFIPFEKGEMWRGNYSKCFNI